MDGCWQRASVSPGHRRWGVRVLMGIRRRGGFLSLLYFSVVFCHCQNWTAPGEMLNIEGSNFWPRNGEPSVSQPFFNISCTFCRGHRLPSARGDPMLFPTPLALPCRSSHRRWGCMTTRPTGEGVGSSPLLPGWQQSLPRAHITSVLPLATWERADSTQGSTRQLFGRAEPRPMWVHP